MVVVKQHLLNILFNNINDYDGEILINNTNIKNINLKSLHGNIFLYVSQDDALFNDTIINNIILDEKLNNEKNIYN
jgi:ATP-binding cassette subfamily B protein